MREPNLLSDVLLLQSKSLATNWILDGHVGKSLGTPPAKSSFLALDGPKEATNHHTRGDQCHRKICYP